MVIVWYCFSDPAQTASALSGRFLGGFSVLFSQSRSECLVSGKGTGQSVPSHAEIERILPNRVFCLNQMGRLRFEKSRCKSRSTCNARLFSESRLETIIAICKRQVMARFVWPAWYDCVPDVGIQALCNIKLRRDYQFLLPIEELAENTA